MFAAPNPYCKAAISFCYMSMLPPAPFDLNLRHLRALSAVVAQGSLSAAAQSVSLSQPALPQGLRTLERQLDARLFERHSDGVAPPEAGLRMADRSAAAIDHLAAAPRGAGR